VARRRRRNAARHGRCFGGQGMSIRETVPAAALAALLCARASSAEDAPEPPARLEDHLGVADGLRVRDVVDAALRVSHDGAARREETVAARADVQRAQLGYVPRVSISASYTRLSPIDAPSAGVLAAPADQTRVGLLSSEVPLLGVALRFPVILDQTQLRAQLAVPVTDYLLRVAPGVRAARAGVRAATALEAVTARRVAMETEAVYWSWARAVLAEVVAARGLSQARAHRDDAARLVAAGVAVAADVARAEAQVAQVEELVATTAHARDAAEDRLRTVTGIRALPRAVGEALDDGTAEAPPREQAVAQAWAQRSELAALDAQVTSLRAMRALQDAARYPRLDLVAEALLANPNPRFVPQTERFDLTWAVGAQVSFTLNDALAAGPTRDALDARVAATQAQREAAREGIRAEVVDAERALRDAASAIAARRAGQGAAERALRLATDTWRAGRGTGLAVIDAQNLLLRAELDLLQARIDLRAAQARHRYAREASRPATADTAGVEGATSP